MFLNYLKVAFRSLLSNRVYSLINLLGLGAGMSVTILILLFVSHEMSYDRFHDKSDRIFRMLGKVNYGGQEIQMLGMSAGFGPLLKEKIPAVQNFVRVREAGRAVIQSDERHRFFESNFIFADPSFFEVFSFGIRKGVSSRLTEAGNVLITEAMALKYFGTTDVIGRVLQYNQHYPLQIVGVMHDAPSNSSLQFDFVASFSSLGLVAEEKSQFLNEQATLGAYTTYLLLDGSASETKVESLIASVAKSSVDEHYLIDPLTTVHLGNNFGDSANAKNIFIFLSIAAVILVLALINYMNLTTARAMARSKEVGIRKLVGATRLSLSGQFYLESAVLTLSAFLVALVLTELFMPVMLATLGQRLDHAFFSSPIFLIALACLLVVCILLSGSYPAIMLSTFKPLEILKGNAKGRFGEGWIRKGFTSFQFIVSIGLIICTLVVKEQLQFLRSQDVGLSKDEVLVIQLPKEAAAVYLPLKNELRQTSGIKNVAASSMSLYRGGYSMFFTQTPTTKENVAINVIEIDDAFPETVGLTWTQRSEQTPLGNNLIINESAVSKLKLEGNPLELQLSLGTTSRAIAGMVKDFNYTSLHNEIDGLVLTVKEDTARTIVQHGGSLYVRLEAGVPAHEMVSRIKQTFDGFQTGAPFEYYFLDDAFDELYQTEDRLAQLFESFTLVGIVIACLGLFGLVTFSLERRVKEIGIRKVLGASVQQIMQLLTKEFVWLFGVSALIAAPLAWWAMEQWLSKFAYRVAPSYGIVAMAIGATLAIAWTTIRLKTWRVSRVNPTESLRNE